MSKRKKTNLFPNPVSYLTNNTLDPLPNSPDNPTNASHIEDLVHFPTSHNRINKLIKVLFNRYKTTTSLN